MIRAAAKNYKDVVVVVNPEDYSVVINELKENGEVSLKTKLYLCYGVFEHTAAYDALITQYLRTQAGVEGFRSSFTPHIRAGAADALRRKPCAAGGIL